MIPSSSELRYFLEVANTKNLSRAAERLGVSQPALTLAIKRLEDSFGQDVIIRSKTGVRLTRGGARLVTRVRGLLGSWESICSDADEDSQSIKGIYSVGCHPSVAIYTLPLFLKDMLMENEGCELRLVHDMSRNITESVISGRLDYGFAINPVKHPDLVLRPILSDEVTFWVAKKPSALQNPKSEDSVLISDEQMLQATSLKKQMNKKGFKFSRTVMSSNLEVICSLVSGGAGVGIIPTRVAMNHGGLKPLSEKLPKFHDKLCLVYRADTPKTVAHKKIVDYFEESLKKHYA